jgi:hypothetical protein
MRQRVLPLRTPSPLDGSQAKVGQTPIAHAVAALFNAAFHRAPE